MRQRLLTLPLLLLCTLLSPSAQAADKLKTFYSGSGGIDASVHRVVMIEFASDDGSALLQQNWHGKQPQSWNASYTRTKNTVTLTFEPARNAAPGTKAIDPLVMTLKHGTLTPSSWDTTALGPLGPPKLSPFGGKVHAVSSVKSCQSINSVDPTQNCITWDSRQ